MKLKNIDLKEDIMIIAEIGNNHEGSYSLAEEMIGLAVEAGVHAVKFQTFKTQYFVSQKDIDRFNRLKSFELSEQEFIKLSEYAKKSGVLFISTPLDLESSEFLKGIVDAYKIASGDNNFYPLIKHIAGTSKPVILSSGLADLALIKKTKNYIEEIWQAQNVNPGLAVLHCVTAYPVPNEQANLRAIEQLQRNLDCVVGYSDHTLGIMACQIAVTLGARIIEKHFTVDKNYSSFRDHQISADVNEMKQLLKLIQEIKTLLGTGIKEAQPIELPIIQAVRRSVAAKSDLQKNHILSFNDLMWTRPGDGLASGNEHLILGKKLKSDIKFGDRIMPDMVE